MSGPQKAAAAALCAASVFCALPCLADVSVTTIDSRFIAQASREIGALHADAFAGADLWGCSGGPRPQAWSAVSLSAPLRDSLQLTLAGYAFSEADPAKSKDGGVQAGLSFQASSWLAIGGGVDLQLWHDTRPALFAAFTVGRFGLRPARAGAR